MIFKPQTTALLNSEFMDAYNSNYHTLGTSETLKKLYCLNLTKQHERE